MKYCTHCGTPLEDDTKFCSGCGMQMAETVAEPASKPIIEQELVKEETPPAPKKKKKGKKGKIIAITCIVLILAALGVGAYFGLSWYFSDEQQLLRALDSGDFEEAMEIVEGNVSLRSNEKLIEGLEKRIDDTLAEYSSGKMEYSAINLELDTIEKLKVKAVTDKVNEARAFVEKLNVSRTNFATAEKFFASGEYVEAMGLYAKVIEDDSNYDTAKAKYTEAVGKYRDKVLAEAAQYADSGNYRNAIVLLNAALKNIPDDAKVTEQVLIYEKAHKDALKADVLSDAAKYAEKADYISAMRLLKDYLIEYGSDVDVELLCDDYCEAYVDVVLDQAAQKVAEGNYPEALVLLRYPDATILGHQRITAKYDAYEKEYVDSVLKQSNSLFEKKKYDEAHEVVSVAIAYVSSMTQYDRLSNQLVEIKDARPKNFVEVCTPYESDQYTPYIGGATFMMGGKEYGNGFTISCYWGYRGYAYFNLDGMYTQIEFDLGHIDGSDMDNQDAKIYLDGVLYKSYTVSADGLPQHITIPLDGVMQMRIVMTATDGDAGFGSVVIQ